MSEDLPEGPLVLFDGVCNLCRGSVQFVLRHERNGVLRFASLQSPAGQSVLEALGLPTEDFDSFVYVEDGQAYVKSAGALRVARHLESPWSWLWATRYVPRLVRNVVYDLVAGSRYSVFGRQDSCWRPTPELQDRFLDEGVEAADGQS